MKKLLLTIIIIVGSLNLSGCAGSIYSQYREIEQMRVIQTMGIDKAESGVKLSLASAGSKNSTTVPAILSGTGKSISTALQRIRNYSCEESLFCAHVGHILIGEDAAKSGIENILSYICHSSEIRVDLPVYVLINSPAHKAMNEVGNENKSVTEILQAVQSALNERGESHLFTAAEIIRSIEKNGSALVCALEYATASENDAEKTAAIYGYGIFKDYSLVQLIDKEASIGVGFLLNKLGICELIVKDINGNTVALEINRGKSKVSPIWNDNGDLKGLDVQAEVSAAVLEISGKGSDLDDPRYEDQLIAQLEAEISKRISSVLQLSKKLGADFLDLSGKVQYAAPGKYRKAVTDFEYLLPNLEISISVKGKLSHTYDIKDA